MRPEEVDEIMEDWDLDVVSGDLTEILTRILDEDARERSAPATLRRVLAMAADAITERVRDPELSIEEIIDCLAMLDEIRDVWPLGGPDLVDRAISEIPDEPAPAGVDCEANNVYLIRGDEALCWEDQCEGRWVARKIEDLMEE